jgi:hypothetical protein
VDPAGGHERIFVGSYMPLTVDHGHLVVHPEETKFTIYPDKAGRLAVGRTPMQADNAGAV